MAALEQEGLLVYEPNRGFRVRGFTIADVAAAIEGWIHGVAIDASSPWSLIFSPLTK